MMADQSLWYTDWPIAAWVLLIAGVGFAGQYVLLRVRQSRYRVEIEEAERELTRCAAALREYGRRHEHRLPETLSSLGLTSTEGIAYRWVPRLDFDARLILVHDAWPRHQILEFPSLRAGRGVVFCSGRYRVVTEDAWDKLRDADDVLREKLGLPEPS